MSVRKLIFKVVPVMICVVLLLCSATVSNASAKSKSAISNQIAQLESKSKALEKQIFNLKKQKSQQTALKAALQEKISNTQQQISLCSSKISEYKTAIVKYQSQIAQKNKEIDETKFQFKQRMRTIYMNGGEANELMILLGSDSFADYLSLSELSRSVSAHDNAMINKIISAVNDINKAQAAVKTQIEAQNDVKAALAAKQADLRSQQSEINGVIKQLGNQVNSATKQNQATEDDISGLSAQIAAAMGSPSNSAVVYSGQAFVWPVPGYYNLTSTYGMRWGRLHGGIDISSSGIYGKKVVAVADGVVLTAGWSNGGFGNYVVINHGYSGGRSYVTLYGHMSAITCHAGQRVTQGQQVGNVGSTGDSTGAHLHFEVHVNGGRVNPMNYYNRVR